MAMTNFSKTTLPPVEDGPQNGLNVTWIASTYIRRSEQSFDAHDIIAVIMSCICIIGLVGNGIVIVLLVFHVKRSPFTTYILNLAVADFGDLLFSDLYFISLLTCINFFSHNVIFPLGVTFMHNTSQLLLTAISIDRCVSVLFPLWHRCHRPPRLSAAVCALIWVLSCLPSGSVLILEHFGYFADGYLNYQFVAGAFLCLPLITVSTLILLFKVFCKPRQPQKGRLFTIVLLTLLFYLIFAFPLNAVFTLVCFTSFTYFHLLFYGFICSNLNSCVNPVIFYMVGRKKRGQQRQSLKVILQRAFEEKEEHREEGDTTAQTPL